MSLLGPDDLELSKKERKKKLARDLSPEVYKQVEKWIEREDDQETFKLLSEIGGDEDAQKLLARRKGKTDPLLDDRR